MQDWWQQRSQREQWLMIGGGIFVVILLFYLFIWQPVTDAAANNKQAVQSQARLLLLMKRTEARVKRFQAMGVDVATVANEPLLSLVEKTFAQRGLSQYIQSIKQAQPGTIELTLDKVPFDAVMQTIEALWDHSTISVTQLKVTKTDINGVVNMQLVLKQ